MRQASSTEVHNYPNAQEAESVGSGVQGQPGLYSETVSILEEMEEERNRREGKRSKEREKGGERRQKEKGRESHRATGTRKEGQVLG